MQVRRRKLCKEIVNASARISFEPKHVNTVRGHIHNQKPRHIPHYNIVRTDSLFITHFVLSTPQRTTDRSAPGPHVANQPFLLSRSFEVCREPKSSPSPMEHHLAVSNCWACFAIDNLKVTRMSRKRMITERDGMQNTQAVLSEEVLQLTTRSSQFSLPPILQL